MTDLRTDNFILGNIRRLALRTGPHLNNRIITDFQMDRLVEKILWLGNLNNAYRKVKCNKGAGGANRMSVDELLPFLRGNQVQLIQQLRDGKYNPSLFHRAEIPKETKGGFRKLGVPTEAGRGISLIHKYPNCRSHQRRGV